MNPPSASAPQGPGDTADVLVVGHGPVGQTLAALLAGRGRKVTVVERWPRPYPMPRAVAFDGPAARVLASAGIAGDIRRIGEPSRDYVVENASGEELLRVPLRPSGPYGWPDSTSMYQPGLEEALTRRGGELPGLRVLRGHRAVGIAERDGAVELVAEDVESGERRVLTARWAVGCDGANSFVRDHGLRTGCEDFGFALDWMACDVVPHRPEDFPPLNLQIADPARPRVAVSAGPGHRRWEFMRMPHEPAGEFGTTRNAWRLLSLFGVDDRNATLERHAVYTFRGRVARRWRRGRMLVAGDAAHQMPPFAGQGMCSGLRDAANLAWKLDLVLAGAAGEELLDTYERERRPHVRQIVGMSVGLGRLICETDPAAAAERDRRMLGGRGRDGTSAGSSADTRADALAGGYLHRGPKGPAGPAGVLLPQAPVADGRGGRVPFDEIARGGFVLLTRDDPAEYGGGPRAALERLGARPVRLLPPGTADASAGTSTATGAVTAVDTGGAYHEWLAAWGARAALVRPDFHVFGAARDLAGTGELLHAAAEGLRTTPAAPGAATAGR
ncbi:bifunctional 3-(3-hydroxy-phenyl)propionate/3-hydroxycinnamic acid hydroxylase [Streptomyces sp. S1A]|uniref:bifunctional 3-(3-hydroxy-phenyl)propionate/3-hydroxycinnamic acid hydroxylase MhpA n=1 Tax=Streptomyces sp. ICN903 TaxID=2964654 RepID=UPI001EDA9C0A|nr:bifunctional 3-(3-hydroxy-phenyl)propionate/3-hydroxycinnamic acid hydroxylase [Streptomyces sp. ICN903]MCG3043956.1 bifunctional 3-(3-hydroxy-phenyl)propionate/3-hydroxycinnamic acid hydroxylase [Streptomyces sp. ICN903]